MSYRTDRPHSRWHSERDSLCCTFPLQQWVNGHFPLANFNQLVPEKSLENVGGTVQKYPHLIHHLLSFVTTHHSSSSIWTTSASAMIPSLSQSCNSWPTVHHLAKDCPSPFLTQSVADMTAGSTSNDECWIWKQVSNIHGMNMWKGSCQLWASPVELVLLARHCARQCLSVTNVEVQD